LHESTINNDNLGKYASSEKVNGTKINENYVQKNNYLKYKSNSKLLFGGKIYYILRTTLIALKKYLE
jgi:hypothetical protein